MRYHALRITQTGRIKTCVIALHARRDRTVDRTWLLMGQPVQPCGDQLTLRVVEIRRAGEASNRMRSITSRRFKYAKCVGG